jgi:hypothetical protein
VEEIRPLIVLLDINVLLDVFLSREPWLADAKSIWAAHNRREIIGQVAAHGFTNLFYIARRTVGAEKAREAVRLRLQTFEVIPSVVLNWNTPTSSRETILRITLCSPAPWQRSLTPSSPAIPKDSPLPRSPY